MKINTAILSLLFLFLNAMLIESCTSPLIEEEISALESKNQNEINTEDIKKGLFLLDKDTSRPGNQGKGKN